MPVKNSFERYLKSKKISDAEAAAELDLTRSYVQMLRTGSATPGLHTAAAIQKWSRGRVTFESWIQ